MDQIDWKFIYVRAWHWCAGLRVSQQMISTFNGPASQSVGLD